MDNSIIHGVNVTSKALLWAKDISTMVLSGQTGWFFQGVGIINTSTFAADAFSVCIMNGRNSQFYMLNVNLNTGAVISTTYLLPAGSYPGYGGYTPISYFVGGVMCLDNINIPVGNDPVFVRMPDGVHDLGYMLVTCTGNTTSHGVIVYTHGGALLGQGAVGWVTPRTIVSKDFTAITPMDGLTLTDVSGTSITHVTGSASSGFIDNDSGHIVLVTQDSSFGRGGIWRVDPVTWKIQAALLNRSSLVIYGDITAGQNTITNIRATSGGPITMTVNHGYVGSFMAKNMGGGTQFDTSTFVADISDDGKTLYLNKAALLTQTNQTLELLGASWASGMTQVSTTNYPSFNTDFYCVDGGMQEGIYIINVATMRPVKNYFANEITWDTGVGGSMYNFFYNNFTSKCYIDWGGLWEMNLGQMSGGGSTTGEVVTWLANQVGVTNIDASQLTDTFNGWFLSKQAKVRECMDQLKACFLFDACEHDSQVVFRKRTNPVVATIPFADLSFKLDGSRNSNMIKETRQQEVEIPRVLTIRYANSGNAYQAGTQLATRMEKTTESRGFLTFDSPLAISDSVAANMAQQMLGCGWSERTAVEFLLPPKYMLLDATDVIILEKIDRAVDPATGGNKGTVTYISVRLHEVSLVEGYILSCKGVVTNSVSYDNYVDIGGTVESLYLAAPAAPIYPDPIPASAITMNYTTIATSGVWQPNTQYTVGTIVQGLS